MPELPEVETTLRGVAPHVLHRRISRVLLREPRLRWPVPEQLVHELPGHSISSLGRRGKYLLFGTEAGNMMIHLGMSGSLRIAAANEALRKHDHLDIVLDDGRSLRFHDPRRFGSVHWFQGAAVAHPLLAALGPEPLGPDFDGDYLFRRSRKRKVPVKSFIMDSHVVVGVGNIYASEALFASGVHPQRKAGRLSLAASERLANEIRRILAQAIEQGGTTLRDFVGGDGKPGYFKQSLAVYGRGGEACLQCGGRLREIRLGQRSTVYCPACQK